MTSRTSTTRSLCFGTPNDFVCFSWQLLLFITVSHSTDNVRHSVLLTVGDLRSSPTDPIDSEYRTQLSYTVISNACSMLIGYHQVEQHKSSSQPNKDTNKGYRATQPQKRHKREEGNKKPPKHPEKAPPHTGLHGHPLERIRKQSRSSPLGTSSIARTIRSPLSARPRLWGCTGTLR
jgi:hypothetical protein